MQTKIKTEWDLTQFYKSPKDPQIDRDIALAEKVYTSFDKKSRASDKYLKDENSLLNILKEYESMADLGIYKPYVYLNYILDTDSKNDAVRAKFRLVSQTLNKISNKIIYFEVKLSKIEKKDQAKFLSSKKLSHFKYFLKKVFDKSKYVLTESEEKILSIKNQVSADMWVEGTEKILNKIKVSHEGKDLSLGQASVLIHDLNTQKERLTLHKKFVGELSKVVDVAENELNAIVTDKKIDDELRGYKKSYDATILGYQNDRESVLNLIKTVTESFPISHRFFNAKAKMLGLKEFYYSDRAAKVGKVEKKITFNEALPTLQEVFCKINPEFKNILDRYLRNGQIDVYPKVGKTSGAYCSSYRNNPTMVLLNHTDTFKSLMTFAHEMGHAIHSEFSRTQGALYDHYSMSTAEVASTLFETFVFYHELEKMSEKEKIVALHDKIHDDIQTIFRQVACFNFEVEMHDSIREKGSLSGDELSRLMNKHMQAYLGPKFKLEPEDGLFFVQWSHIRRFYYVYTYAFGQLASKAIYKKYSEDKSYIKEIEKFLSMGGSKSPEDIFKSIGIDVKKPDFFKNGIKTIEEDIVLLEKLIKKA